MACKNAFYAQSGGVIAVINPSVCGVLQSARQHSEEIGNVYEPVERCLPFQHSW